MTGVRRPSEGRVLSQPTRAALLACVHQTPGIPLSDVAKQVGVHYTTVEYHARVLRAHGHVRLRRVAARVRVFPARMAGARQVATEALHPTARRVLAVLGRMGPLSQQGLARAVRVPRTTLQWHVEHLRRLGAVQAWRDGNVTLYMPGRGFPARPPSPGPSPPSRPPVVRGEDAQGLGG